MNYIAAAAPNQKKTPKPCLTAGRPQLSTLNLFHMELTTLQNIVKDRYYQTDKSRGIYHTALWFHEEVGELSSAIASGDQQNAKEEFADVLMWLLTLANLMDINMEEAVEVYLNNPRKLPTK
jgi:NTP pyrophosphatase (non-canonical NTP hydrolase)